MNRPAVVYLVVFSCGTWGAHAKHGQAQQGGERGVCCKHGPHPFEIIPYIPRGKTLVRVETSDLKEDSVSLARTIPVPPPKAKA
jgi:hypothetical protein